MPPIRSLATTKKKKKIKKANDKLDKNEAKRSSKPRDYRAWDKLDVVSLNYSHNFNNFLSHFIKIFIIIIKQDKLCNEVDENKSSSSDYTTDEEWEEEQKKVKANWEKERVILLF